MMGRVKISSNCGEESTSVSNIFIDEYMQDANDAQIKIYLFLLRMMSSNLPTSVTALADKFNHTESDVLRSLKYWEKKGLISLEYDSAQNLTGIHMEDIVTKAQRKYGRRRGDISEVPAAAQTVRYDQRFLRQPHRGNHRLRGAADPGIHKHEQRLPALHSGLLHLLSQRAAVRSHHDLPRQLGRIRRTQKQPS